MNHASQLNVKKLATLEKHEHLPENIASSVESNGAILRGGTFILKLILKEPDRLIVERNTTLHVGSASLDSLETGPA